MPPPPQPPPTTTPMPVPMMSMLPPAHCCSQPQPVVGQPPLTRPTASMLPLRRGIPSTAPASAIHALFHAAPAAEPPPCFSPSSPTSPFPTTVSLLQTPPPPPATLADLDAARRQWAHEHQRRLHAAARAELLAAEARHAADCAALCRDDAERRWAAAAAGGSTQLSLPLPLPPLPDSLVKVAGVPPLLSSLVSRKRPRAPAPAGESNAGICGSFARGTDCSGDCGLVHACPLCGGEHTLLACGAPQSVCVRWNLPSTVASSSQCSNGEDSNSGQPCVRMHRCLRCLSPHHQLPTCPASAAADAVGGFCFAYNASGVCRKPRDCARLHRCLRCGPAAAHPALRCPDNVTELLASPPRCQKPEQQPSQQPQQSAPTITSHKRPYLYSDCAPSTTRPSPQPTRQQHPHLPSPPPPPPPPPPPSLPSREPPSQRLLTDSERACVCRNFNNGRCASATTGAIGGGGLVRACRFLHVCLRCGAASHLERACPLPF
ncbi:hypothetical protein HK405_010061 [Cladochytrium tenue]|nr:hypothetical protein HK405_010061 [Cladochytrium tenue]